MPVMIRSRLPEWTVNFCHAIISPVSRHLHNMHSKYLPIHLATTNDLIGGGRSGGLRTLHRHCLIPHHAGVAAL